MTLLPIRNPAIIWTNINMPTFKQYNWFWWNFIWIQNIHIHQNVSGKCFFYLPPLMPCNQCILSRELTVYWYIVFVCTPCERWGGWGCEVSFSGHHWPREKTTTGPALDGAVFDIAQILAYLVHNMSRSQLYLGFGHFGWLPYFFRSISFGGLMVKFYFLCWNYSLSSGWHIIAA